MNGQLKGGEYKMLQEIIRFLAENPDVLEQVKEGTASLIGVSEDEKQAILKAFVQGVVGTGPEEYWL